MMKENVARDKKFEAELEDKHLLDELDSTKSVAGYFYPQVLRKGEEDWSIAQIGDIHNKRILIYGSGGYISLIRRLARGGATIIAIDISPVAVGMIKAIEAEFKGQIHVLRMDAEALAFQTGSFDVVYARSIIHHLDLNIGQREISQVLKESGMAVCIEPLGQNPVINLFRRTTPSIRSPSERPLTIAEVEEFVSTFTKYTVRYCYLTVLPLLMIRRLMPNRLFERCLYVCDQIDQKLFQWIPWLRKFAWAVMLFCIK